MRGGHSLIGCIFEGGIGNADALLVVLSEHSTSKPWVREELDADLAAVRGQSPGHGGRATSFNRAFPVPETGKIAVKVINHYGDEVMQVYEVGT